MEKNEKRFVATLNSLRENYQNEIGILNQFYEEVNGLNPFVVRRLSDYEQEAYWRLSDAIREEIGPIAFSEVVGFSLAGAIGAVLGSTTSPAIGAAAIPILKTGFKRLDRYVEFSEKVIKKDDDYLEKFIDKTTLIFERPTKFLKGRFGFSEDLITASVILTISMIIAFSTPLTVIFILGTFSASFFLGAYALKEKVTSHPDFQKLAAFVIGKYLQDLNL